MERRPWTRRSNRRLPLRFRDHLPRPLPSLPPRVTLDPATSLDVQGPSTFTERDEPVSLPTRVGSQICRIFTTPRNIFGLSRKFYGKEAPLEDPEAEITLQDLSNTSVPHHPLQSAPPTFYPFPNRNAFIMSDWFWNGGVQKSRQSFRELMNILGDPEFKLEDIRDVDWDRVNKVLATDDEGEWVDEDAVWVRTPVTISVPYQPRRGQLSSPQAGPRNYLVEGFYHRNLVDIIREKISGLKDGHFFHIEPYEMLWQPENRRLPIRIQGELYTSPSFIDAHRELQDSPGEPGCELPRVIVALMFWSDGTHLTSFGNAKLWPLYLFFGNESKYRRCKPSCNLCEHVAYFQSVSNCLVFTGYHSFKFSTASRLLQRLCCNTDGGWKSPESSIHHSLRSRAFPRPMENTPRRWFFECLEAWHRDPLR